MSIYLEDLSTWLAFKNVLKSPIAFTNQNELFLNWSQWDVVTKFATLFFLILIPKKNKIEGYFKIFKDIKLKSDQCE